MEEENKAQDMKSWEILAVLKELVVKVDKLGLKLYHMENKIDEIKKRV